MGTHPNGPSKVKGADADTSGEKFLKAVIDENPAHWLGSAEESFYKKGDLPFLFKVLSVNQALSIQAHPNKTLAEQVHKADPKK